MTTQTDCRQCGSCCIKGGPALHQQDMLLLQDGEIPLSHLVTIRCGELADHFTDATLAPVQREFVKLSGNKGSWSCRYYDEIASCTIYACRPQACRVLKCWEPSQIVDLMGKNLLSRKDILGENHPMLPLIVEHESIAACDFFSQIQASNLESTPINAVGKKEIEQRVQCDLQFRSKIVQQQNLSLGLELFYFGRPLFQLLRAVGVDARLLANSVHLFWSM